MRRYRQRCGGHWRTGGRDQRVCEGAWRCANGRFPYITPSWIMVPQHIAWIEVVEVAALQKGRESNTAVGVSQGTCSRT